MKYVERTRMSEADRSKRSPGELESDVRQARADLGETLHKLEDQISPRALVDQLATQARRFGRGSSEFAVNLGSTVRDNPIPVVLLLSGIGALIASERSRGSERTRAALPLRGSLEDWDEELPLTEERSSRLLRARERADELGARARQLGTRVRTRAGDFGTRTKGRGAEMRAHMRETLTEARGKGASALEAEPLVAIGLGLALGALLGTGVPVGEHERRAFRPSGQRLRERARAGAEHVRERQRRAWGPAAAPAAGSAPHHEDQLESWTVSTDDDPETDERMES